MNECITAAGHTKASVYIVSEMVYIWCASATRETSTALAPYIPLGWNENALFQIINVKALPGGSRLG